MRRVVAWGSRLWQCGAGGAEARAGPAGRPAAALRRRRQQRQPRPERGGQAARSGAPLPPCVEAGPSPGAWAASEASKVCVSAGRSGSAGSPALCRSEFSLVSPPLPLLRVCSYGQARRGLSVAPRRCRPPGPARAEGRASRRAVGRPPRRGRFRRAVPAPPRARGGAERQTTLSGGSLGSCVDEERS